MEIPNPLWGLNMTGFRLVDKDGDPYVSFIERWRSAITNDTYAEVEDLYRVSICRNSETLSRTKAYCYRIKCQQYVNIRGVVNTLYLLH